MKEGWICPKCGKVWAPFIPACICTIDQIIKSPSTAGEKVIFIPTAWTFDKLPEVKKKEEGDDA